MKLRPLLKKRINKKAQIESLVIFIGLAIGLMILAPVVLKINGSMLSGFSNAVRPISNVSADAVDFGMNKFTSLWDTVIICAFVANTLLLFVSAFLIDIHPSFIAVYIVGCFFLFMFAPNYLKAAGAIFDNPNFSTQTAQLAGTSWLYNNFGFILLGIVFITGIIMFAKYKMAGRAGGSQYY